MGNRILVIDDQQESLDLFVEMLTLQGFTDVSTALSGQEGLKAVVRYRPDVILLDILMPQMDGFMFYKALKTNPATANIPVVVITARGKMEDAFRAMGVEGFFAKPFDAGALLGTIQKLAARRKVIPQPTTKSKAKTKNVLIFSQDGNDVDRIASDLRQRGYATTVVQKENKILEYFGAIDFDLVILELYLREDRPLDEMIELLRIEGKKKKGPSPSGKKNARPEEIPVIIYKVSTDVSGAATSGDEIADTDHLLKRCREFDNVKYIGHYSAATFLLKIKEFI